MENINELKDLKITEREKELLEWTRSRGIEFMRLMTYYKCAIRELETKFKVLDEEFSLNSDRNPISTIKSRVKSVPSIIGKLNRLGLELSVENIDAHLNDIAGVRVVCSFIEDVYNLADTLLKQDDIKLIRRKDYIKNPKENGYRSLHLIVEIPIFLEKEKKNMRVEIQLRTIAMDCWASLEHQLRYKKGREFTEQMQESLFKCAKLSSELDLEMDSLRESSKI